MIGVRDLWLSSHCKIMKDENERKLLHELVDKLSSENFPSAEVQSCTFSFVPTKTHKILRFMENLEVDYEFLEYIASISVNNTRLYCVWVDARDLSFHNFENILPLDRALCQKDPQSPLQFSINNISRINKTMDVYSGKLEGNDIPLLLKLDELGLYQSPANSATRGGERFIFSSNKLGSALSSAVTRSTLLKSIYSLRKERGNENDENDEDGENDENDENDENENKYENEYENRKESESEKEKMFANRFVMVNPVFRYNKFSPGDNKFHSHMDTPYYDAAQGHVSKYTLLIYLSGGQGGPALHIKGEGGDEVRIDKLESMQCIVFNQRYEHEGSAFFGSNKIFLRTELIFKIGITQHNPAISSLFSSAVYYTIQSLFQPELAKHAHTLYEKVNRAHWGVDDDIPPPNNLLLHKSFNSHLHFATNGNDYFFPYSHPTGEDTESLLALKTFALVAALDYLNCKVDKKEFGKWEIVESLTVPTDISQLSSEWIINYLWEVVRTQSKYSLFTVISKEEKQAWLDTEMARILKGVDMDAEEDTDDDDGNCCELHAGSEYDAEKDSEVKMQVRKAHLYAKDHLLRAPLIMLGEEMRIDPTCILVEGDKIFINSTTKTGGPTRVNFAACWSIEESAPYFVGVDQTIPAPRLVLPPISFTPVFGCSGEVKGFHLMIDLFRNDFWIKKKEKDTANVIPLPNFKGMKKNPRCFYGLITTNADGPDFGGDIPYSSELSDEEGCGDWKED